MANWTNIYAQKVLVPQKKPTARTSLRHPRMKATEIPAADKEILIGCDPGADLARTYWDRTSKVAGCAKVRILMHGTRSSIWCPPKCGLPQAPLQPPRL